MSIRANKVNITKVSMMLSSFPRPEQVAAICERQSKLVDKEIEELCECKMASLTERLMQTGREEDRAAADDLQNLDSQTRRNVLAQIRDSILHEQIRCSLECDFGNEKIKALFDYMHNSVASQEDRLNLGASIYKLSKMKESSDFIKNSSLEDFNQLVQVTHKVSGIHDEKKRNQYLEFLQRRALYATEKASLVDKFANWTRNMIGANDGTPVWKAMMKIAKDFLGSPEHQSSDLATLDLIGKPVNMMIAFFVACATGGAAFMLNTLPISLLWQGISAVKDLASEASPHIPNIHSPLSGNIVPVRMVAGPEGKPKQVRSCNASEKQHEGTFVEKEGRKSSQNRAWSRGI